MVQTKRTPIETLQVDSVFTRADGEGSVKSCQTGKHIALYSFISTS